MSWPSGFNSRDNYWRTLLYRYLKLLTRWVSTIRVISPTTSNDWSVLLRAQYATRSVSLGRLRECATDLTVTLRVPRVRKVRVLCMIVLLQRQQSRDGWRLRVVELGNWPIEDDLSFVEHDDSGFVWAFADHNVIEAFSYGLVITQI